MGYVLAVALLTWGGVFLYLVRLEGLTRAVEKAVRAHASQALEANVESNAASEKTPVL